MRQPGRLFRTFLPALLLVPASAFAQDTAKVGLVMAIPASVSFIWHASDTMAIRPEFDFSGGSAETSAGDLTNTVVNPAVSVLFYLQQWDDVRSYVSPRYEYQRSSAGGVGDGHTDNQTVAGSIGVQFTPHRRFGVFGETGIGFVWASAKVGPFNTERTATSWSVRASVGAILYF
jgi:hypothetical protein